MRITTKCGKFFKRWGYQSTLSVPWETCIQIKNKRLELDMEKQTGTKLGKEYVKAVYCLSAYLTYMQGTWCEMLDCWSTSWNQDCWAKYQQPQIRLWYHSNGRKWRGTKEPDEGERGEWKSWLNTQHLKNNNLGIWSHHFNGTADGDCTHEIKRLAPWKKSYDTLVDSVY